MQTMNETKPDHTRPPVAAQTNIEKRVAFSEIAGDANEVLIEHDGQTYRLRLTRNGKLILNK